MPKVAFREIRSRGLHPNWDAVTKEPEATMERKSKPELIAAHERIVADWHNKPEFRARKFIRRGGLRIYVFPAGEHKDKWIFVSGGTRAHRIPKTGMTLLAFKWGGPGSYRPKTAPFAGPRRLAGGQPTKTVFRMFVNHPGSEPRRFEKIIARVYKPIFARDMENAFRRGVRRARRGGRPR